MLYNNYKNIRNILFGNKTKKIINRTNINPCLKIKEELNECLKNDKSKCLFLKNSYQLCIKNNSKKIN